MYFHEMFHKIINNNPIPTAFAMSQKLRSLFLTHKRNCVSFKLIKIGFETNLIFEITLLIVVIRKSES